MSISKITHYSSLLFFLFAGPMAMADIGGFSTGGGSGGTQWSLNKPICCVGPPTIAADTLHLAQNGYGGGSAFYNTPQNLGVGGKGFTATFTVQLKTGTDLTQPSCMTFVFQNAAAGAQAIGGCSKGWGYGNTADPKQGSPIESSVAFYLDFWTARFGFVENPPASTFTNIPAGSVTEGGYFPDLYLDLTRSQDADPVQVTINYDGVKTLKATLTDTVHPNSASYTYTLNSSDLAAATHSDNGSATVGFTQSTLGSAYFTDISQVSFSPGETPPPSVTPQAVPAPAVHSATYTGSGKIWRILPVGDSITNGSTVNGAPPTGGYRTALNTLLTNAGVAHLFVGTRTSGPPALLAAGQGANDGHDGKGTAYVLENISKADGTGWLETQHPDLVLLHIGVNDVADAQAAVRKDLLDQIVAKIFAWAKANPNPDFHLLITQISSYGVYNQGLFDYDAYIRETLFPKYKALGEPIVLVDQYTTFERVDRNGAPKDVKWMDPYLWSAGGPHPNQAGYDKMGGVWYDAIMAMLQDQK